MMSHMHERRYRRGVERLRSPERLALLEVDRVVALSLDGLPADVTSVLDIGTGSGVFAEKFAAQGLAVSGIDANPDMLQAAQAYVPTADFRQSTAEKLPFENASFDIVFMGLVFHETDDPLQALHEAYRVCTMRSAILEWQYAEQNFGPPLAHRIQGSRLSELASQAGFSGYKTILLSNLVLYLLEKA